MDGKVTYWIEMSDYDLETADVAYRPLSLCGLHVPPNDRKNTQGILG